VPFINDSFPNFADGVSQQPMVLRLPTQGDIQENGLSDPSQGLSKRPCSEHLSKIGDFATANSFGATIIRSADEAYFLLIRPNQPPTLYNTSDGSSVTVNVTEPNDHAINSITYSGATATATTASAHGLSVGDKVQINSAEVTTGTNYYNGEFTTITGTTGSTIKYTMSASDTAVNASGSPTFAKVYSSGGDYNTVCDYVKMTDPSGDIRIVSIADETFILNKNTTVKKSSTVTTNRDFYEAAVWVRLGDFGTTYTITITENDGTVNDFTHTVKSTNQYATADDIVEADTTTKEITEQLFKQLNGGSSLPTPSGGQRSISSINVSSTNLTAPVIQAYMRDGESVIYFKTANRSVDFTIEAKDSKDFGHMRVFKGKTSKFANLPTKGPTQMGGFEMNVAGDFTKDQDDFYVRAVYNTTSSEITYEECAKDNIAHQFDATTLPRRLVRNSDGTYSLKLTNWDARTVGDDETNPYPDFVNRKLSDIFYHQGRLGFLSEETLYLSETNETTNFWLTTVLSELDTQAIAVSSAGTEISNLEYAIPHHENLIMFSKLQQLALRAESVLTTKSAAIKTVTTFETSMRSAPTSSGRFVFFAEKRGGHTGIREYYVDSTTNTMDAQAITMHVNKYIPGEATQLLASSNVDLLLVRTDDSTVEDTIFVYRYTWVGSTKVQAAWSTWKFDGKVRAMGFVEADLILVIERTVDSTTRSYIEKINLGRDSAETETDQGHAVLLDRRVKLTTNSAFTNFTSTYYTDAGTDLVYVDKFGDQKTASQITTDIATTALSSSNPLWAGVKYDFLYRFSEPVVRVAEGQAATTAGRIQLRTMSVNYSNTGFFKIVIKPQGHDVLDGTTAVRTTSNHTMNGRIISQKEMLADKSPIVSGTFRFPVYSVSTGVQVEIQSDNHLPCSFQGGEWEAQFHQRTRRI
jgi:hypothetical protein